MSDTTEISLRDRYVGTLLGLACGDALGGPLEFLKRDVIAARFPAGVTEFIGGGWLDLDPGEVTDDSRGADSGGVADDQRPGSGSACRRVDLLVPKQSQRHRQYHPNRSGGVGSGNATSRCRGSSARGTWRAVRGSQRGGDALRPGCPPVSPGTRSPRSRLARQRAGDARGSARLVGNNRSQPGHCSSAERRCNCRRTGRRRLGCPER